MKFPAWQGRTLKLLAVIIPLLALFAYAGLRSGPLAPVAVTMATVESRAIAPALFGVGTVESRYSYQIGPTSTVRVMRLDVHAGDRVTAGQVLGEMDPVDLDDRVRAQESAFKRAQAALREAQARHAHARRQADRYAELIDTRATSEETFDTRQQELQIAEAALAAAQAELARTGADREALRAQRSNLRLIAPVDGMVTLRDAEPGSTVVPGQSVLEVIDTRSLWVNVRFDQISASGVAAGLPARIVLRSRKGQTLNGRVLRVEPTADAVTEEILAKVVFDAIPEPLPPVGELAEVTVELPALAAAPAVLNAAIRRDGERIGVWQIVNGGLRFTPVKPGTSDLDGYVQVPDGLAQGDRVVLYSEKTLSARSRIKVVDHIPGVSP